MNNTFTLGYGEEKDRLPNLSKGQRVTCPRCGKRHAVKQSKDADGVPGSLLYYLCKGKPFLAGVGRKNVMSRFKK